MAERERHKHRGVVRKLGGAQAGSQVPACLASSTGQQRPAAAQNAASAASTARAGVMTHRPWLPPPLPRQWSAGIRGRCRGQGPPQSPDQWGWDVGTWAGRAGRQAGLAWATGSLRVAQMQGSSNWDSYSDPSRPLPAPSPPLPAHLLVAALHRAVSLKEVHSIALAVSKDLHLQVGSRHRQCWWQ
jgi:hypothetical protein